MYNFHILFSVSSVDMNTTKFFYFEKHRQVNAVDRSRKLDLAYVLQTTCINRIYSAWYQLRARYETVWFPMLCVTHTSLESLDNAASVCKMCSIKIVAIIIINWRLISKSPKRSKTVQNLWATSNSKNGSWMKFFQPMSRIDLISKVSGGLSIQIFQLNTLTRSRAMAWTPQRENNWKAWLLLHPRCLHQVKRKTPTHNIKCN